MAHLFLFIGTTELLLIGGMALLLFGGKKLPEMMRGLGQGVKEFKQGMQVTKDEGENDQPEQTTEEGEAAPLTEGEKKEEEKNDEQ